MFPKNMPELTGTPMESSLFDLSSIHPRRGEGRLIFRKVETPAIFFPIHKTGSRMESPPTNLAPRGRDFAEGAQRGRGRI